MKRILLCAMMLISAGILAKAETLDRQWTIYLVQQTHTDIGYTRPQSEILSEHLRYIDYAIDFCDLTADYPDEARFRWTCEAAWPVEQYLKLRPKAQVERLKDCIRRGQIEVTGMYFNMAEIADEAAMRYFFHPLAETRKAGIPVKLAMQNDVNGAAWCLSDYLHDMDVKYFWIGSNKTKSLLPFEVPTIFRWVSPSRQEVVAFRSMHYMTANFWGIEKNDTQKFEERSAKFLNEIAQGGYPFDEIGIQHLGYYVDNAPPSYKCCDFVKEWNETHENPKLRIATASEFLDHICEKYGKDKLPVQKVAWPDWWTDGFGSAAKETGEARKAQADMISVNGLLAMSQLAGEELPESVPAEIEAVYNNLLFWDEHTFGAAESISNPSCWNSQIQFDNKASYAWTGLRRAKLLYETAGGLLQGHICPLKDASVTVFNPLLWERNGIAEIFADYDIMPKDKLCRLIGENGEEAFLQVEKSCPEGRYFKLYADKVPSLGYKTYRIVLEDLPEAKDEEVKSLENQWYKLEFDTRKGGICSIIDKAAGGRELVQKDSPWALGTFIYETLKTRDVLFQFKSEGFTRYTWTDVQITKGKDGYLFESVVLKGKSDAAKADGVSCEVRLYKKEAKIELVYHINRDANFKENSIYVAFPFTKQNPKLALDVQGGTMYPGENQLEGSATEWNTLQNFVAARAENHQILLGSKEAPILMLGDLLDGPFEYLKSYDSPTVYSWVMNNYWCTNFKASQQDEFTWSYFITSTSDTSDKFALRNSISERVGMYGRVVPKKAHEDKGEMSGSLLKLNADDAVLASGIAPASFSKGVLIQLRNTSDSAKKVSFTGHDGKDLNFVKVNALEEEMEKPCKKMSLEAGADVFVLIRQ